MKNLKYLFGSILLISISFSCQKSDNIDSQQNEVNTSNRSLSVGEIHNIHLKHLHDNFSSKSDELQYTNNYFVVNSTDQNKLNYYQNRLTSLESGLSNAWNNNTINPYINSLIQSTNYSGQLKTLIGSIITSSSNQLSEGDLKNAASQLSQSDQIIALELIDVYHRSEEYWTEYTTINNITINGPNGGGNVQAISLAGAIDMAAYMYVHSGTTWGSNWKDRDIALAAAGQVSAFVMWLCCP